MEAELILLSREHLEIIFMLSSCTEVLKNWLLFRQVTDSLHYPRAEGLCRMMSKQCMKMSPIWSVFLAVTRVCVDIWSTLSKSWKRVPKSWKLRLKQIKFADISTTKLLTFLVYMLLPFCEHWLASPQQGSQWSPGDVCGLGVWGGKADALSFGRRQAKGVWRPLFSLQGCLPTSGHCVVEIMPLQQMDLVPLGKILQVLESKHADPGISVRHLEDLVSLYAKNEVWHLAFACKMSVLVLQTVFKWFGLLETSCLRKECYRVNMLL